MVFKDMNNEDIDLIIQQIRCIALGQEIPDDIKHKSAELAELQSGLEYLSDVFLESNTFLTNLTEGILEIETPKKYSALSSTLKDLHSKLRHLTWQTKQVAEGSYTQNVSFLGEFSDSFNEMIKQLSQREKSLKHQSVILSQSIDLLKSIMNSLEDCVIVTSMDTGEIIYANQTFEKIFFNEDSEIHKCKSQCNFLNYLKVNSERYQDGTEDSTFYEYDCEVSKISFYVTVFTIYWNGQLSCVHYIKDVTNEKEFKLEMKNMVYKDQLTNLFNRRFCIEKMQAWLNEKVHFICCVADLDGLKFANDNFGHKAGDDYLRLVASQLSEAFGDDGYSCRLGGDEFVVISKNLSFDEVVNCAKKTDEALINMSQNYPMSLSYGASSACVTEDTNYKQILARADEKMYEFKKFRKKERGC